MTTPSRGVGTVRNHRRFALADVTFDGATVGGATIDLWQNDAGATCWSARLLMVLADGVTEGLLAGSMRDGRRIAGRVSLSGTDAALKARGPMLVEWHGITALAEATDPA
jgi:hypothetical protein